MPKDFNHGDTVYSLHGQAGRFVARCAQGYIVEPIYESDDEPDYHDTPTTWREVFKKPPVEKLDHDVAALEAKLKLRRQELDDLREQRNQFEREEGARKARITAHDGMQHLDDFLAGKITHFVYVEDATVATFAEVMNRTNEWREKSVRLLGLYGDPRRVVRWEVSEYHDGSGSRKVVIPCTSEEQALNTAREVASGRWAALRADGDRAWGLPRAIKRAQELGMEVPADLAERAAAMAKESAQKGLQSKRKHFADAQQELAKAEAEARAAGVESDSRHV